MFEGAHATMAHAGPGQVRWSMFAISLPHVRAFLISGPRVRPKNVFIKLLQLNIVTSANVQLK